MSVTANSSYDQAMTLFTGLSFAEKLSFLAESASLLKKEGKTGSVGKAAKKEEKKSSDAPKRAMPAGTMAWVAFVKHCKEVMPERFEGMTRPDEKMKECKKIKEDDLPAYEEFKNKFVESYEPAATAEAKPETEKVKGARGPQSEETKKAAAEKRATNKAAKDATVVKPAESKAEKIAKIKAAAAPKAKKEPKKVAVKQETEDPMPKKTIDGETYWFCPDTNGLWKVNDGNSFGGWVGKFQPDNESDPILFSDSPADE